MRQEFGKWFLDIAKYVLTALILSRFFGDLTSRASIIIVSCIFLASIIIATILLGGNRNEQRDSNTGGNSGNVPLGSGNSVRRRKKRRQTPTHTNKTVNEQG